MKQPETFKASSVTRSNVISLEKGKIPPQAIDLEEVVLGAMMIDKKGVDEVIDILSV
ncbi:MAG: DnaB-like helicase N-terminal domain-containing protein, partial [Bacteroidota bacterium]|nr:DnaB-like helicase N-terminal domain-containing protein [Bacteroidota bacterium]